MVSKSLFVKIFIKMLLIYSCNVSKSFARSSEVIWGDSPKSRKSCASSSDDCVRSEDPKDFRRSSRDWVCPDGIIPPSFPLPKKNKTATAAIRTTATASTKTVRFGFFFAVFACVGAFGVGEEKSIAYKVYQSAITSSKGISISENGLGTSG